MTPTKEQVEAVANAIGKHQWGDDWPPHPTESLVRNHMRDRARAAIAAMQPTVAQVAEVRLGPEVMKWRVIGERMAAAIDAVVPISQEMFAAFPYAEKDGDDEALYEAKQAVKTFRDMSNAELIAPDIAQAVAAQEEAGDLCDDCPPVGYPTDKTRCTPCPRRALTEPQQEDAT